MLLAEVREGIGRFGLAVGDQEPRGKAIGAGLAGVLLIVGFQGTQQS